MSSQNQNVVNEMKIGIIDVNDIKYNESDMLHSNFIHENINETLSDFIVLKSVSNEDAMMQTIVDEVVADETSYPIHTAVIKHVNDDLYIMCHIAPSKEIYEELRSKSEKYNGIASYLTDMGLRIYKKAVIYKVDTRNNTNKLKSITMEEITSLFINKFVHKGIILNIDDSIDEFKFIFNPVDWISPSEIQKYKFYETEILGKIFMLFVDTSSSIVNNIATKIYSNTIKGRVIVGMRDQYTDMNDTEVRYIDIDTSTFKKVIQLFNNSNSCIKLKDDEDNSGQIVDGKRIYTNFHKILANRSN